MILSRSAQKRKEYGIRCKCCGRPGTATVKALGVCMACLKAVAQAQRIWTSR